MKAQISALPHVEAFIRQGRRNADYSPAPRDAGAGLKDPTTFLEEKRVTIADARGCADQLSLDDGGFILMGHATKVTDFFDRTQIDTIYDREMKALIANLTGAIKVVVLEILLRGPKNLRSQRADYAARIGPYANMAHMDCDEVGFRNWAADLLGPEEAPKYRNAPFGAYNVWRALAPVETNPLALCDASTIKREDFLPIPPGGYLYQSSPPPPPVTYFHLAFDPAQRWYYFPHMTPEEVAVFKQFDTDSTRPYCVAHTAFDDPTSPPNPKPRVSIEARMVAFFDNTRRAASAN